VGEHLLLLQEQVLRAGFRGEISSAGTRVNDRLSDRRAGHVRDREPRAGLDRQSRDGQHRVELGLS
jgi:hypothetical protein